MQNLKRKKTAVNKENSKRANTIKWRLPVSIEKIRVCKTFFLETLDISDQMVITANKKALSIGICSTDKRGKHKNRPHSISLQKKQFVREHIKSFPTVDSHYCRKDSQKQYLSPELSVSKMYRLYVEKCQSTGHSPVKLSFYHQIFCKEFNISFHKPLKDLCDICSSYKNVDASVRSEMEEKYLLHLRNKEAARENKTNDKDRAKFIDDKLCVACFDLQEILTTPKSFESVMFYKRKLNTFNLTVYDLGSSQGVCYIWNETIARRGASDISSCIFDFIKTMSDQGKKKFIFYSDNCSAQNKNRYYISMLWYCINLFNLESVEHKYLEKGHTQNEGDSVHATIEHASRNISVYTTGQWAAVIRTARPARPYTVKEMSQNSFFNFAEVSKCLKNFDLNLNKDKVYFSEIKTFRINSSDPNTVHIRYNYGEPEQQIDLTQRLRKSVTVDPKNITLSRLYDRPLPLTAEKYHDLISLCRDRIIPQVYHPVYLLLPHE